MTRPRLWTGEAVLDHALEVAGFKPEDLARAMEVTRDALEADTPTRTLYARDGEIREVIEGGADHPTRLRASENIFGWVGLRGARKPTVEATVLGDLVITWRSEPSSSPTLHEPFKPSSTPPLLPNGHAPLSSSATDDLANL